VQPGLQQPGRDLKTFPGWRREDELKARGTFSCHHLWEKTPPAPAASAGREHRTVPSSWPGSAGHPTTVSEHTQSLANPRPPKCHRLPALAVAFHMRKRNSPGKGQLAERDAAEPGGCFWPVSPPHPWSQPRATAARSPALPRSGTVVSMLLLPRCAPEGREPKCLGLPSLRVQGAGEPLGPWVQPRRDPSLSLQKGAEQPETSRVPWPLPHARSGAEAVRTHGLLRGCESPPGTAQGSPTLPTWQQGGCDAHSKARRCRSGKHSRNKPYPASSRCALEPQATGSGSHPPVPSAIPVWRP